MSEVQTHQVLRGQQVKPNDTVPGSTARSVLALLHDKAVQRDAIAFITLALESVQSI